jgi:hypothetical protein
MVKTRRNMRKFKNMKGGDYTANEIQSLKDLNFTNGQIVRLNDLNITYEQIQNKIAEFNGPQDELADFVDNYFLNNEINENPNAVPMHADNMQIIGANEDDDDLNDDPLNMSDLSIASRNSGYTTKELGVNDSGEFGGNRRRKKTMRKNKKHNKNRKSRKSRKYKKNIVINKKVGYVMAMV